MLRSPFIFSVLLYVGAALTYSWLMPPWEAPDEPAHYILAANLARIDRFSSLGANYEAHQPQPYYRLMSVPLEWLYNHEHSWIDSYRPESNYNNIRTEAPVFEWDAANYRFVPGLYTLRWLTVLIGAGAVAVNAAALRRLFPDSPHTALAATILLAFIPQFLHISSAVANDTLASLGGAVLFWALVRIVTGAPSVPGYLLAAGAAAALPLGTKLSAIPMGIAVLLAIGFKVRATRGISWWAVAAGALVLAGLVALAGLALPDIGRMWLRVIPGRVFFVFEGAFEPETIRMMLAQLARTFWGQVGWIGAGLPGWMVAVLTGWAAFGFGSAVRTALRERGEPRPGRDWALIAAGIALAIVLRNGFYTIANQGRLLFPALGPIAFAVLYGWSRLVPERVRERLPWIVGGLMLFANLWLVFDKILPTYFQPFLDD